MYCKVIVTPVTVPFGADGTCRRGRAGRAAQLSGCRAPGVIRALYTRAIYPIREPGPVLAIPGEVG